MQIQTADDLLRTLQGCGLFTAEQLDTLARELAPLGDDPPALVRHVVDRDLATVYQLRKVLHGKTAELLIGPYVVLDKIGEGGMGRVYRARHTPTDREVALKVVRANLLANPIIRGRYEREITAAATLNHPNIVRVFDAGESDGRCYLAMEFVDGIDLARLVRKYGFLPVAEACEYVRQAALGLQHAHDLGFIHRDIKPSNIVVSGERHVPEAEGPAHVKLLDMGLVRAVGLDEGPTFTDLTRAGTVVGTPDYMAPEQARNSSTIDHRADLYGLGCTLHFLLTGKPPFPDGTPIEKLLKHQVDPPPPLQLARPDVPNALAGVIARLMAKKPEGRYQAAREFAAAIEPFSRFPDPTGEPLRTPAPSPLARSPDSPTPAGSKTLAPPSTNLHPPLPPAETKAERTPQPRTVVAPRPPAALKPPPLPPSAPKRTPPKPPPLPPAASPRGVVKKPAVVVKARPTPTAARQSKPRGWILLGALLLAVLTLIALLLAK